MIRAKDFTIFKAGHWNGEDFTQQDLDNMVKSFDGSEPIPIIIGHSSDYRGHTRIPSFGRITGGLKRIGNDLVAVGVEFHEKLAEWIKNGFYNQRSIELTRDNKRVLALGMLGAVPPAVKGLPANDDALTEVAMQFSEENQPKVFQMAEDEVEEMEMEEASEPEEEEPSGIVGKAVDDTFKTISQACGRFLEDVEEMLESEVEHERLVQEVWELQADIISALGIHEAFMRKIESIEEEGEFADKRPGWKEFVAKVKGLFTKHKEAVVDKQKEQQYLTKIQELETKVKEYAEEAEMLDQMVEEEKKKEEEEKVKVEEEKKKAEEEAKVVEAQQVEEVKQMCEKFIAENRMTPAMREKDEIVMLTLIKKDKDAFKSFCEKYSGTVVPLGIEPALIGKEKPNDNRPLVIRQADEYCKAHPKEFAGLTSDQAISRAMWLHSQAKIKFEDK